MDKKMMAEAKKMMAKAQMMMKKAQMGKMMDTPKKKKK